MNAIEVKGVEALQQRLNHLAGNIQAETNNALFQAAELIRSHMVTQYLTSGPLHVRTGRLRGSWRTFSLRPDIVILGSDVKYARAQNYGFHGPVFVREHTRRVARDRRPARVPRTARGKLRVRAEARARREHLGELERQSRAAHGISRRQLQTRTRTARRARGLQGGVEPARGVAEGGRVLVRAHGRFMKLRGHLYVERSLRDRLPQALALVERSVARAVGP